MNATGVLSNSNSGGTPPRLALFYLKKNSRIQAYESLSTLVLGLILIGSVLVTYPQTARS
jgi:hypothetical protein